MPKNLVIVESATKAKTIEKILGQDFKVVSCVGHISDLPVKELGVDVNNDFKPKYVIPTEKKPIIRDLKNYELELRIADLESKFSKDLSETTFNELKELKKQQKTN